MKDHLIGSVPAHLVDAARPTLTAHEGLVADYNIAAWLHLPDACDLLVSLVFLIDSSGETTVMTKQIVELLGTRGGNWEILTASAFITIIVPLCVFFALQRYLVRGLLAGSVKGG